MGIAGYLKHWDAAVSRRHAGTRGYFTLSPSRVALRRVLQPLIAEYALGTCLDAGAGWQAHRHLLLPFVERYIALDLDPKRGRSDVLGSTLELPLRSQTLDTVYCSQVLEHVTDDLRLFQEFERVLKPGGILILTAPHLGYLHNEPHDYRRVTRHGQIGLARRHGLEVLESRPAGGLLCFLAHPPSVVVKALAEPLPIVREGVGFLNGLCSQFVEGIDRILDRPKRYALNEVLVARRPK